MQFKVFDSFESACDLRTQWDDLWRDADAGFGLSFTACRASWRCIYQPLDAKLQVAACFDGDHLVALWPLVCRRHNLLRVLEPLAPRAVGGMADLLVARSRSAPEYVEALWLGVRPLADVFRLEAVKESSQLASCITHARYAATISSSTAPYLEWSGFESWDDYFASLSATTRKVFEKKRRRLLRCGRIGFAEVRSPQQINATIDWMLREKRRWADKRGDGGAWLYRESYRRYLEDLVVSSAADGRCTIYLLTLDGQPIAAQLSMEGSRHIDWIIASFSNDLSRYSPGMLLNEHCLRHAFERRLRVEFYSGGQPYKLFWSHGVAERVVDHSIALSRLGVLAILLQRVGHRAIGLMRRIRRVAATWFATSRIRRLRVSGLLPSSTQRSLEQSPAAPAPSASGRGNEASGLLDD